MGKEFVPYKEALALKELGFDMECIAGWRLHTDNSIKLILYPAKLTQLKTPLYQQAFKWFRKKYGKHVILFSDGFQWTFDLRCIEEDDIMQYPSIQFPKKEVGRTMHDTYEEAQITALRKLIDIVK